MSTVKLQGNDFKEPFEVDAEVACCSQLITNMANHTDRNDDEVVTVPKVRDAILRKIMEWAKHHKDDPEPPKHDESKEQRTDDISCWDAAFIDVDKGILFELMLAADFLDVKGLLDLTCKAVAIMIKGKSPDEIRKLFNIENDLTTEMEEQVRAENKWIEEK